MYIYIYNQIRTCINKGCLDGDVEEHPGKFKAVHCDCQQRSVYNSTNLSIRELYTYEFERDSNITPIYCSLLFLANLCLRGL